MTNERTLFNEPAPPKKKDKRSRFQFRFWLDCMKDEELLLAEELDELKRKRSFQTTIRDGLRLILDLRRGNTGVLRAMFPDLFAQIETEARAKVESPANAEFAALLADAITQRLPQPVMVEAHALPSGNTGELAQLEANAAGSIFTDAGAGETVTASEARVNFAAGMGSLFDDDDDVWED